MRVRLDSHTSRQRCAIPKNSSCPIVLHSFGSLSSSLSISPSIGIGPSVSIGTMLTNATERTIGRTGYRTTRTLLWTSRSVWKRAPRPDISASRICGVSTPVTAPQSWRGWKLLVSQKEVHSSRYCVCLVLENSGLGRVDCTMAAIYRLAPRHRSTHLCRRDTSLASAGMVLCGALRVAWLQRHLLHLHFSTFAATTNSRTKSRSTPTTLLCSSPLRRLLSRLPPSRSCHLACSHLRSSSHAIVVQDPFVTVRPG